MEHTQSVDTMNKIRRVISAYKSDFDTVNAQERYKWEAIGWYKRHWNIDSPHFAQMVADSFGKAGNLLSSGMYYPYRMLTEYAQADPEAVRSLFRMLHNEELPLAQRYVQFRNGFEKRLEQLSDEEGKTLQHYQDLRAVMVYLTFEYPDQYFLFKSRMYSAFRDRVGYAEEKQKQKSAVWKIESYNRLCQMILKEIQEDSELIQMSRDRLDDTCYADPSLHLLAMDIIFYGSVYMKEQDFAEQTPEESSLYWPSLSDYDPGLSKEDWKRFLTEIEMPDHPVPVQMLRALMDQGGEATCKKLADVYGGHPSRYVGASVNLGKRAKKYFSIPSYLMDDRDRCYIIPFQGRVVLEDGTENYSYRIRPELHEALKELDLSAFPLFIQEEDREEHMTDVGLNTILYGPPGTGKTYHTVIYAVAIIENKKLAQVEKEEYSAVLERYHAYKDQGRIAFTTFHQSYGYEEFIEGIRPVISDEEDQSGSGQIQYSVQPGIFQKFCERAERPVSVRTNIDRYGIREDAVVWKVSLWSAGENEIRTECLSNGHIRIGWDQYGKDITDETDFSKGGGGAVLNAFINRMQIGDVVLSCYNASTVDAVGVITGDYEWDTTYPTLCRVRKVNWLAKNLREPIQPINGGTSMTQATVYRLWKVSLSDVYRLIEKHCPQARQEPSRKENHVFIIDEINRGNISKIFGELITLIEAPKRKGLKEETTAILPYSQKTFGVPQNVYIIGTMNTADRSIAAIDTALRRRFFFREMMPDPKVLADICVEDLKIGDLLERMNRRIAVLYDREHTIGHSYFLPLKHSPTVETLAEIFANNIIPLLQEYFYEDYEKIRLVLGDNQKRSDEFRFILARENDYGALFGDADVGLDESVRYEINREAFGAIEAYRSI